MRHILIADNDPKVRSQVGEHARSEGYLVAEAEDGETAVTMHRQNPYDFVLLAGKDGFSACQAIRTFSPVPIMLASQAGGSQASIRALELGADDFLQKPLEPKEVLLRISAILKRGYGRPRQLISGGITVDLTARRALVDGAPVSLTPKEFDLLAVLMSQPDAALSRRRLLETVWGEEHSRDTRTLDTHIKQIRRAIAPYSKRIVTLRGVGYRFDGE
jgi:DNA-binding response OmpR family regulator